MLRSSSPAQAVHAMPSNAACLGLGTAGQPSTSSRAAPAGAGEGKEHFSFLPSPQKHALPCSAFLPACNSALVLPSKRKMKCSFIGFYVGYKMFLFFFFPSPCFLPGNTLIYGIILANPSPEEHKLACAQ